MIWLQQAHFNSFDWLIDWLIERYSLEAGPSAHWDNAVHWSPIHTTSHFDIHSIHTWGDDYRGQINLQAHITLRCGRKPKHMVETQAIPQKPMLTIQAAAEDRVEPGSLICEAAFCWCVFSQIQRFHHYQLSQTSARRNMPLNSCSEVNSSW